LRDDKWDEMVNERWEMVDDYILPYLHFIHFDSIISWWECERDDWINLLSFWNSCQVRWWLMRWLILIISSSLSHDQPSHLIIHHLTTQSTISSTISHSTMSSHHLPSHLPSHQPSHLSHNLPSHLCLTIYHLMR